MENLPTEIETQSSSNFSNEALFFSSKVSN